MSNSIMFESTCQILHVLENLMRTKTPEQIRAGRWATLAVLCLSLLVVVVDNSIVNVALPTLARQLHASTTSLQWVVDAYTLATAGLLLTLGSLGDRVGRHRTLKAGLLVFGLGSVLAALSSSAAPLIAFRALMGIGAAAIMPSTLSILTNVFTVASERAKAIALWSAVPALRVAVGPTLGGWPARALQLGLNLHGQRAHRGRGPDRRAVCGSAISRPSPVSRGPGWRGPILYRPGRHRLCDHRGSGERVAQQYHAWRGRPPNRDHGRVGGLGTAQLSPDGRPPHLP